ncbi:aminopeptidase N-like [Camponotus floridanus]|uniref:aminopeptidase N-like n=1 Tax=Camponotus floridanus TaxID=104421 RepID=UPI000DC67C8D|nr:aminopeptidase N-like [Camponotus floridanus]
MIFLKLFLNILLYTLIFIGATASFSEENSETDLSLTNAYRLSNNIIPYHYNIEILWPDYQPEITNFIGKCKVYVKINRATYRISLHAQKPQINITYAILKKDINLSKEEISYIPKNQMTYDNESHILDFYFTEDIPSGNYYFIMEYTGLLNDNENIFKNSYVNNAGNKIWLYAAQAIGARQIFPCWDEPEFKATFNLSIKHHKQYITLSNIDWNVNETNTDFMNTKMHINITSEMSTYQIAFCLLSDEWFKIILSFYLNSAINFPMIIVWKRNSDLQISFAEEIIVKTIKSFKNDWKNLNEISIIQFVLMPGFQHNAIEKRGLIFERETAIMYDKEVDSFAHKIEVACLIACQVAYQWFGITVSPSWWSYHWLNQGLATLLGIEVLHKNFVDIPSDLFVVQMQQESLRLDDYSIMEPLVSEINKPTEINSLFSFSYYIKAPAILRMLQYVLSDEIFKKGIEKFYKTHMFRSATLDNFYNDMQIVYDREKKSYMQDFIIKDMMDAWIKQKHYPILKVIVEYNSYLIIKIENYKSLDKKYNWWIPITITKQTKFNFKISTIWYPDEIPWFKDTPSEINPHTPYFYRHISIQQDKWYIINLQQIGYYRVNYNLKNWQNIAKYLNSAEYTNIHVLNRAQIIDDAYHFAMRGTVNFSIFLNLTEYLSRETDYVAWYPMFKILEDISRIFPFPDKIFNIFKTKILNSLNGLLQNIDYDKKPNEKSDDLIDCLRQEASKWACILGEPNCVKAAETKLHQHLINPKTNKLLPWWRHWTFCNGLMIANDSIWFEAWKIHSSNPNSITSKFLACSDNSAIIIKYTEMLFNDFNTKMRGNFLNDILYIIAKRANNNETLDTILKNLKEIPR